MLRLILSIINILLWLSVLAWPMGLLLSGFIYDAPTVQNELYRRGLAISLFLYPVPVLIGTIKFYRNRKSASLWKLIFYTFISVSGPLAIVFFIKAYE